jgi:hypothetical protein
MQNRIARPGAAAVGALLLMTAASCSPLDAMMGDVGVPNSRASLVTGEVRSLDDRRGRLAVRDDRGRNHTVRYDHRTRVGGDQRIRSASQLRRGDYVRMQVVYDRNGTAWANRIDVRNSTNSRGTLSGRVERIDGTVGSVDTRRGTFTIQQSRTGIARVHLSNRTSRDDRRRFDRLRRGERVRAEVRALGRNEFELVRFR